MEESPGSTEARCRLTAGGGDPRESATENKPPAPAAPQGNAAAGKGETVRHERTAPLATGAAGQTPPGARPNRGGRHGAKAPMQGCFSPVARVGRARRAAMRVPEEWPSRRPARGVGQNPAYRPSGTFSCESELTRRDSFGPLRPVHSLHPPACRPSRWWANAPGFELSTAPWGKPRLKATKSLNQQEKIAYNCPHIVRLSHETPPQGGQIPIISHGHPWPARRYCATPAWARAQRRRLRFRAKI